MSREKIKAKEYYVKDLLSDKFLFEVPTYQRPYCWTEDNIKQFMDDILDAIHNNKDEYGENFDCYEPYFVGSIILSAKELKDDGSGVYDIIDGQQRITTMVMLIATIRDLIDSLEYKNILSSLIYQKANPLMGVRESLRLRVRDKEMDFFRENILEKDGTSNIINLNTMELNDPKQNMVKAVSTFIEKFKDEDGIIDESLLNTFIMYLLQRVVLVSMITDSFTSAFKLFNVINARGLPLTNADLLKSDNLRAIEEHKQDQYAELWENCEDDIGREKLEMLIGFIRGIKLKKKASNTIFEEFTRKIFEKEPKFRGKNFITYLCDIKEIYEKYILEAKLDIEDKKYSEYYSNLMGIMRDFIPFNEWMSAVISFVYKYRNDQALCYFIKALERKIAVDWINGLSFSERTTRIYKIISLIEQSDNYNEVLRSPMLNGDVRQSKSFLYNSLNDLDFYTKGRMIIPKYVLIRMDMERCIENNIKIDYTDKIIIEHILPRRPNNPYWKDRFSSNDRGIWANRLGNLALINGSKSSQYAGKDFDQKIKSYVVKKGDFSINQDIFNEKEWNVKALSKRQEKLIEQAMKLWM